VNKNNPLHKSDNNCSTTVVVDRIYTNLRPEIFRYVSSIGTVIQTKITNLILDDATYTCRLLNVGF
jgi:hypothetical protein